MNLSDLDLDIHNYDIDDIFSLFKIDYNYDINTLKKIRKQVLKLHPDKCSLDPKYFIFFKKAYEVIVNVYKFRTNHKSLNLKQEEDIPRDLSKYFENKSASDFHKEFNEIFEKVYMKSNEENDGYSTWMKSDNDFIEKEDEAEDFRDRSIQKIDESQIEAANSSSMDFYDFEGNKRMMNHDIKDVYFKETIIPVNEKHIMNNKPSFTSVHTYNTFRDGELSQAQSMQNERYSIEHMKNMKNEDNMKTVHTAYNLLRKQQEYQDNYQKHISKYLKLKNKI